MWKHFQHRLAVTRSKTQATDLYTAGFVSITIDTKGSPEVWMTLPRGQDPPYIAKWLGNHYFVFRHQPGLIGEEDKYGWVEEKDWEKYE